MGVLFGQDSQTPGQRRSRARGARFARYLQYVTPGRSQVTDSWYFLTGFSKTRGGAFLTFQTHEHPERGKGKMSPCFTISS